MSFLRRHHVSPASEAGATLDGDKAVERWPALWEFLTATVWPDKTGRVPGSLTVFLDAGRFKGCLNDRDAGLVAFVSSASLLGVLDVCDAGLQEEGLDWRQSAQKKGRSR